jgi:hypothetical protein
MALGSTQPLTEMSTGSISWGFSMFRRLLRHRQGEVFFMPKGIVFKVNV